MSIQQRISELSIEEFRRLRGRLASSGATKSHASQLPPLGPRIRPDRLPLSHAQERLWFLEQLEQVKGAYNLGMALRIEGKLDAAALQLGLRELVRRHESLRTHFEEQHGIACQVIDAAENWQPLLEDCSQLDPAARDERLQRAVVEEAQRPFDLSQGPLFRVCLLKLTEQDHVLLVTTHHLVCDGWSMSILSGELSALYGAFVEGRCSPLPELPLQYADYTLWQREWLQAQRLEALLTYWKGQLSGAPALELPTDRPRPAVPSFRGSIQTFSLTAQLSRALHQLSRDEHATLYMVLLAAFQMLLSRYSGQEDIVVGSPIAGRTHRQVEPLIGLFLNTLVLRTSLSGDPSFSELLRRVKETQLDAHDHQHIPLEKLMAELGLQRDLSRQPLFQVMFVLQNMPAARLELGGLQWTRMSSESVSAKFDLSLYMQDTPEGLVGGFEYAADLFDAATIERLSQHFQQLLTQIVLAPQRRLSEFPILSEVEQRRMLVEWNATWLSYPREKCVHELVMEQAARTPDAVAVSFEDRALTYRQLDERSNQLAHHLKHCGVGPEVVVGLCVERSLAIVIGTLAILKAGGAYLPLDPQYPPERLRFMMEDARAPVLLTHQPLLSSLPVLTARRVLLDAHADQIAQQPLSAVSSGVGPENLAYLLYTSGSTGRPKGVMGLHRCFVNRMHCDAIAADGNEVYASKTTIGFIDFLWEVFMPLIRGQPVVLVSDETTKDPRALIDVLAATAATRIVLVPSLLRALLEIEPKLADRVPQLKHWVSSGEALSPGLAQSFSQRLPQARLLNVYGTSEFWDATVHSVSAADGATTGTLIGRPLANTRVYLLDGHLQPVPVGVIGELYASGDGLSRGYFDRAALTAERYLPNPFEDAGARMYRTGDLARYLPDGSLEFMGRADHQVKIRGQRIELGEIEAVLQRHPGVKQAVAVVREDAPGDNRVVAYVIGVGGVRQKPAELREHLQGILPAFMVPAAFVMLDTLPTTATGKIDRRRLPAPEADAQIRREFIAPRTPVEQSIATIWSQLLKVDRLGVHDNFFELGGHSLLGTQVIAQVGEALGVKLPLRALFEAPEVGQFAARVESLRTLEQRQTQSPILVRQNKTGPIPLSYAQERQWHLFQRGVAGAAHTLSISLSIHGELHVAALAQSLTESVRRHEVLRTRLIASEGRISQVIDEPALWPLQVQDLRDEPETLRATHIESAKRRAMYEPFSLSHGPLLRTTLLRLDELEHLLLITLHHAVADSWSAILLAEELHALYTAFSQRRPSPLPEPPIQYADYAVWQRQSLHAPLLRERLDYWRDRLQGIQPLALAHPVRPALVEEKQCHFSVAADLTSKLKSRAARDDVTLYVVLLTAYKVLLSWHTGQLDLAVGTPVTGRAHWQTQGLLGAFANKLVCRTDLSGSPTFRQLAQRVNATVLGAHANQSVPFEMLIAELASEGLGEIHPWVEVIFAWQNTARVRQLEAPGSTWVFRDESHGSGAMPLSVYMHETAEGGLQGMFKFLAHAFDLERIERLMRSFTGLLRAIADQDEPSWDELQAALRT